MCAGYLVRQTDIAYSFYLLPAVFLCRIYTRHDICLSVDTCHWHLSNFLHWIQCKQCIYMLVGT